MTYSYFISVTSYLCVSCLLMLVCVPCSFLFVITQAPTCWPQCSSTEGVAYTAVHHHTHKTSIIKCVEEGCTTPQKRWHNTGILLDADISVLNGYQQPIMLPPAMCYSVQFVAVRFCFTDGIVGYSNLACLLCSHWYIKSSVEVMEQSRCLKSTLCTIQSC